MCNPEVCRPSKIEEVLAGFRGKRLRLTITGLASPHVPVGKFVGIEKGLARFDCGNGFSVAEITDAHEVGEGEF